MYASNPISSVDPDGRAILDALKYLSPTLCLVSTVGSAINAADGVQGFWRGVAAGVVDIFYNAWGNIVGPATWTANASVSLFNNWGNGDKWKDQWQAIWDNEAVTFNNTFRASQNPGDFFSSMANTGVNDHYAGANGIRFGSKKGAEYQGTVTDERRYSATIYYYPQGKMGGPGVSYARGGANQIVMQKEWDEDGGWIGGTFYPTRGSVIRHELTHVGQNARYGHGGMIVRESYGHRKSEYTDLRDRERFTSYGQNWLSENELEAMDAEFEWEPGMMHFSR